MPFCKFFGSPPAEIFTNKNSLEYWRYVLGMLYICSVSIRLCTIVTKIIHAEGNQLKMDNSIFEKVEQIEKKYQELGKIKNSSGLNDLNNLLEIIDTKQRKINILGFNILVYKPIKEITKTHNPIGNK